MQKSNVRQQDQSHCKLITKMNSFLLFVIFMAGVCFVRDTESVVVVSKFKKMTIYDSEFVANAGSPIETVT